MFCWLVYEVIAGCHGEGAFPPFPLSHFPLFLSSPYVYALTVPRNEKGRPPLIKRAHIPPPLHPLGIAAPDTKLPIGRVARRGEGPAVQNMPADAEPLFFS